MDTLAFAEPEDNENLLHGSSGRPHWLPIAMRLPTNVMIYSGVRQQ